MQSLAHGGKIFDMPDLSPGKVAINTAFLDCIYFHICKTGILFTFPLQLFARTDSNRSRHRFKSTQ